MIKGPSGSSPGSVYRGGGFSRGGGDFDDWDWPVRHMTREVFEDALAPLTRRLRIYDKKRADLETRSLTAAALISTMELLKEHFVVEVLGRRNKMALVDQASVREFLRGLWDYDCRLEIRIAPSGMPLYYVPRIWHDYDAPYSLVLEDVYLSPGYPIADERFVKIMWGGHELYFIRLSPLRAALLKGRGPAEDPKAQDEADALLRKVGRLVFQPCWHEDQYVGMAAAGLFDLLHFRRAVELLYLCLSAELCELRGAVDEAMLGFFRSVYPQPVIAAFLKRLIRLDGRALAEVPQVALKLFPKLSQSFSRFLGVELPWGRHQAPVALYKLLFANFSRLQSVHNAITDTDELRRAAEKLETHSLNIIQALLDGDGNAGLDPDPAAAATAAAV
jgi:hypothetical protein